MAERAKSRTVYVCQECGQECLRWQGRCPECQSWNALVERSLRPPAKRAVREGAAAPASGPVELVDVQSADTARMSVEISEFDRVLGGGAVPGSLILIGGDPGIGKSTLIMQAAANVSARTGAVLYISGEESAQQLKLRAERLGIKGRGLFLLGETNLELALEAAEPLHPALMIVDSIQTMFAPALPSAAGSIAQLRECTTELMRWAKTSGVTVAIVGHVTKEGEIAGPRLLEHVVDVVLYLEGDRFSSYRLLRSVKNRFGTVSEVGVFEMSDAGLQTVENPSQLFLSERSMDAIGSVVSPTIEGTRPLLLEIQALASPSPLPMPRRLGQGMDQSRLLMLTAVLGKRLGLPLSSQDVLVNVAGGLRVQEPAVDLATALAIVSSVRDRPIASDLVAFGEIGLSGELRSCGHVAERLNEAARQGFGCCILPAHTVRGVCQEAPLKLLPARTLKEAVTLAFAGAPAKPASNGSPALTRIEP
jgi:DNA repair protein RadA/Sms